MTKQKCCLQPVEVTQPIDIPAVNATSARQKLREIANEQEWDIVSVTETDRCYDDVNGLDIYSFDIKYLTNLHTPRKLIHFTPLIKRVG